MEQLINQILWHAPYIGVAALLLVSGLGAPIPEDIPLLAAGVLCHHQLAHLPAMLVLTFVAVLGSDTMIYWLGRRYGRHVPKVPILRSYLTEARMSRAHKAFHNHGGKALFIARFLPGLRAPVFFTAGTFHIPFWKLLTFDGSAALISVPILVLAGYFGAAQLHKIQDITEWAQLGLVLLVVVGIVGVVVYRRLRRKVASVV